MSDYAIGDWVSIRAQVSAVFPADIGVEVELFSKTDQYHAMVRPDLVLGKTDPPPQPEPDREYLVKDGQGDIWRWDVRQFAWHCITTTDVYARWESLLCDYAPVTIYGEIA